MARIRILLADDHTVMRRGLRLLLEQQADFEVVGEAEDGRQAVELAASLHPGVAVLDIGMPLLNGIEAARQILTAAPAIAVVVLSMHSDETYVLRALKAGAKGYLLKNSAEADLIQAVRAVAEGKSFFSPVIARMLLEDYMRQVAKKEVEDSYDLLTPREKAEWDALGARYATVMSPEQRGNNATDIIDLNGTLLAWLREFGTRVVALRPDRFVAAAE